MTNPLAHLGKRSKAASKGLAKASATQKSDALTLAANRLRSKAGAIVAANESDVRRAREVDLAESAIDRLRLDEERIEAMARGLELVAGLDDPIGKTTDGWTRPNGLRIERRRVPLGVIGVIYENRPNVTSDAAGLCVKSGNAALLRGSSGAIESNKVIARAIDEGLQSGGLPADSVLLVEETSRESAVQFMQLSGYIDCLVPRGGRSLIDAILQNATVPFVIDGDGNCHIYVDESADLNMAASIVVNAKTQRPGVCNAAESLLVHSSVAAEFLPMVAVAAPAVEWRADASALKFLPGATPASEADFASEFLSLTMAVAVVPNVDAAISHIGTYGSGHSEAIITTDVSAARRFTDEVDAAAVVVNASTRFVDGEQFGFGAEIGISTQKLHCRGPMGPEQLTTLKYVVQGTGQVRQ